MIDNGMSSLVERPPSIYGLEIENTRPDPVGLQADVLHLQRLLPLVKKDPTIARILRSLQSQTGKKMAESKNP